MLASTVTTMLAFMPMALLPGPSGDFVGSIALAVIIMLAVSYILAITITPAISGHLLRLDQGKHFFQSGIHFPRLEHWFSRSIHWGLNHKAASLSMALVLPVMGFLALPSLTNQFFPTVERDQFYIQVKLPGGTDITRTEQLVQNIDHYLAEQSLIRQRVWTVGESAPSFYYNMVMDTERTPGFAEALITTRSAQATDQLIQPLQQVMDNQFPEARILVRKLVQGPPTGAPVEFRIIGPDLNTLKSLGDQLRGRMNQLPEFTHVTADLEGADPKLEFQFDEQLLYQQGLTLTDAANQLQNQLTGVTGGSLLEATEELPVRVQLDASERNSIEALRNINLTVPGSQAALPVTAVGEMKLVTTDNQIARYNGERVNTIQGFLVSGLLPEQALQPVLADLDNKPLSLPPGYRTEIGGDFDASAETQEDLAATAFPVIVLTIVTLFLTFWSYRLMGITLLVIPLSMGLSFLALAVFRYPFGINALIGAIGSVGVSINAAIIILTALQENQKAMAGDLSAVANVVVRSSRHIISTTITTVGGFLPLILAGGLFWPPFAMAIAGGVTLSLILAFYFTPAMFVLLTRQRKAA